MADYDIPPYVLSRVRFFDGEFLRDQDFVDEQLYHLDRRQRHDRLLHVAGIAEGLAVSANGDSITVAAGTAVDPKGRQILLDADLVIDVDPAWGSGARWVTIRYDELADHPAPSDEPQGNTRFTEVPLVEIVSSANPDAVVLGQVLLDAGTASLEGASATNRRYTGLRLAGPTGAGIDFQVRGDWLGFASLNGSLRVAGQTRVEGTTALLGNTSVTGTLGVTAGANLATTSGNVGIGTASPGAKLDVVGDARVSTDLTVNGRVVFGSPLRQMINLFDANHGVGTQASTLYFRSAQNFAFYEDGVHIDTALNPGAGGSVRMVIAGANVGIGTTAPGTMLDVNGSARSTSLTVTGGANLATTSGNVGIGTAAPSTKLDVVGEARVTTSTVTGNGTVGGTLGVTGGANLATTSGNVGIGTASPTAKLDVNGDARIGTNLTVVGKAAFGNTTRQMIDLYNTTHGIGTQPNTLYFRSQTSFAFFTGGSHSDTAFDPGAGGTARMVVTGTNVGIGTTTPGARLSIVAPGVIELAGTQSPHLRVTAPTLPDTGQVTAVASFGCRTLSDKSVSLGLRMGRFTAGSDLTNLVAGLTLDVDATYASTAIWLTPNARVGINNTSPTVTLDVSGDGRFSSTLTVTGNVGIGTTSSGYKLDVSGDARISAGVALASSSGNVGIGTTSPTQKLEVWGTTRVIGNIILEDTGSTGRLGIRTTSPSAPLSVVFTPGGAEMSLIGMGSPPMVVTGAMLGDNAGNSSTLASLGCRTSSVASLGVQVVAHRTANAPDLTNTAIRVSFNTSAVVNYAAQLWFTPLAGGRFGIGIDQFNPQALLDVNGVVRCTSVSQTSSRTRKQDISDLSADEALDLFRHLNPVKFFYKDQPDVEDREQAGFIAEDVPDLVRTEKADAILPNNILAVLTRVVHVQQEAIQALQQRIEAMQKGAT